MKFFFLEPVKVAHRPNYRKQKNTANKQAHGVEFRTMLEFNRSKSEKDLLNLKNLYREQIYSSTKAPKM